MAYNPQQPDQYAMKLNPENRAPGVQYPTELAASHGAPMPEPLSDISRTGSPITEEAPQEPGGLQPGNRRSIKEYLEEIRIIRENQRLMGVPENELQVPTFTNIQGGPLDISQGPGVMPEGQMGPGEEVSSYVQPEYVQGPGGPGDLTRGPEHPVSRAEDAAFQKGNDEFEKIKNITNKIDPRYPMAFATQNFEEAFSQYQQQKQAQGQGPVTSEESQAIAISLRNQAFEMQGEYISGLKKKFPDADITALWKANESGNWAYASSAGQNLLSTDKVNAVKEDAFKVWRDHITDPKNMGSKPIDPDTGAPFANVQDFAADAVGEYTEMITSLLSLSAEMSGQVKQPTLKKPEIKGDPGKHGKAMKTGTDRVTGKKVTMYEDGTVLDEEGNIVE